MNSKQYESPEAARRRAEQQGLDVKEEAYRFGRPPTLVKYTDAPPTRRAPPDDVDLEVIDLRNKRDRTRFLDLAAPIYAGDPNYIAPLRLDMMKALNPDKFAPFEHIEMRAVIAHRGGRPVGRLTCQIDDIYNAYHETKAGWFGYFESIDDPNVAHALFDDGLRWLKDKGMVEAFGPANPTMVYQSGLLIKNFDRPPCVENLYNPPYYEALFDSFGFGKAKDLYAWWIDVSEGMTTDKRKRVVRIADRIRKREGITVRRASVARADEEIALVHELMMAAWEKNWGFAPIPKDEFMELAQDLKKIVIEDLLLFIMVEDRPVAFSFTVPDVYEKMPRDGRLFPFGWTKLAFGLKKTKHARMFLLGTLPEYRKRGLESIMFAETVIRANKLGIMGGEISWTLEDNDLVNRAIESMEGRLDRVYRIYGLDLTD